MLKLILNYDFDQPVPAVDRSPFANHGQVIQAAFAADGRETGSGALHFQQAGSAVRTAWRPVWQKIVALAIEAWIFVLPNGKRRNIIEGDGSFAFFLDPDDTLVGSVFSLVDGAGSPNWNIVSSGTHSPDGMPQRVPLNRWCKVVFHHDGLTRARLFLDDRLIGVRGDYRSGVGAVGLAGVVTGNWTLANQFPFAGAVDSVRVWKRDEAALIRDFTARPISPAARDAWDDVWACLDAQRNPDLDGRLRQLGRDWEQLIRELFRAVHAASSDDRQAFRELVDAYRAHWRGNTIDSQAAIDTILALRTWIAKALGPSWAQRTDVLVRLVLELWGDGRGCLDRERLAKLDPAFAGFITGAAKQC
jgi:Concanavalin A-like lectin/glucanases superfamily